MMSYHRDFPEEMSHRIAIVQVIRLSYDRRSELNRSSSLGLLLIIAKMDKAKTNQIKHTEVKQLSHNLMNNECRWKTSRDKKKVRMVKVVVWYYTNSQGNTDCVSMECCAEHQDEAEESLIKTYGLTR